MTHLPKLHNSDGTLNKTWARWIEWGDTRKPEAIYAKPGVQSAFWNKLYHGVDELSDTDYTFIINYALTRIDNIIKDSDILNKGENFDLYVGEKRWGTKMDRMNLVVSLFSTISNALATIENRRKFDEYQKQQAEEAEREARWEKTRAEEKAERERYAARRVTFVSYSPDPDCFDEDDEFDIYDDELNGEVKFELDGNVLLADGKEVGPLSVDGMEFDIDEYMMDHFPQCEYEYSR